MRFIIFSSLHFILCIFFVNVGVSAKPRLKTLPLPLTLDHTNIELDVNKTILSTTENQLASTTEKFQIDVTTETINHQNENKEPDLVTSKVTSKIEETSGKADLEELSTISSNLSEEIELSTGSRNANNGGEETEKLLPVQLVDLSLISELLNIPRVMQNASIKFSNLRYVFVYNQEPTKNNSLSKVLIKNPEVHTRMNSLQDVDTDLNNSAQDHSRTKRTIKLVELIFNLIKQLLRTIRNFLSFRIKRLLPFAFLKKRSNRSKVQKCINELPPLQN